MCDYEIANSKMFDINENTILFGMGCLTVLLCKAMDNGYSCELSSQILNLKLSSGKL